MAGRPVSVIVDDPTIPAIKRIPGDHVVLDSILNTDDAHEGTRRAIEGSEGKRRPVHNLVGRKRGSLSGRADFA